MWIISASLIASSILVCALASPSAHFFVAANSSVVGLQGSADPGGFASFAIYFSSPRSQSTAIIRRFHGIQFVAFSISIW
ncbi:uncharacterized protein LACBIDRAFT_318950 [Laccaria bicolor S238N-H82]|uniref:Predicted protein n=1 Tax=Laccaria bicolor (strain S238N-H82 / ATCC MYA-4686) TaxID=486041 RepID=B0D7I3_LACBS|nr:uncharacterized protein LACBIDRAFT_318950 [Laccaria bicolor S238N-H82]EDR09658.1 predicted protein [Laccaria bicolor S238N-H82]|eukprot:XP_001880007.1 predicted protein [Laccaria bicolor S238N-H82]